MRTSLAVITGLCLAASPVWAQNSDAPLSAIDWLSKQPVIEAALPLNEPPTAQSGTIPAVTVVPLDQPVRRRPGLLPFSVTGLAPNLWTDSDPDQLRRDLKAARSQSIAATNELLLTLLLAEADDLATEPAAIVWMAARVDALMHLGAVEPALVLVSQAGVERSPALFDRWMTLALLTRREAEPCRAARDAPHLMRDTANRIYCTARLGDVDTAALLFGTAGALNVLSPAKEALLGRFLDPDIFEDTKLPRAPVRPDALTFRLFEAAGEPLPTAPLPRAFSYVDLSDEAGWKAQLEAAERLARTGVLPSNQLLGLYSERKAAASGGIWDRVAALQKFEAALSRKDQVKLSLALPAMWRGMQAAGLEVVFSDLFAEDLAALTLEPSAADIAFRMELLSRSYETAPLPENANATQMFLAAVAQGTPRTDKALTPMARTIAEAFTGQFTPSDPVATLTDGTLGATLLSVLDRASDAGRGDVAALGQVLTDFLALGLEDIARRTALQMLILKDAT